MNIIDSRMASVVRSDINLILPSFNKLTIDYEKNVYTFHERLHDHMAASDSFTKKDITISDQIIKSFDFLDFALDEENIELIGKELIEKYDCLEKDTDYKIIFSQIYRILMVFRNAKVHDSNSILVNNDSIFVVRKDRKGKDIRLIAEKNLIDYVLSYSIYYNNVRDQKINDYYKLNIALWYYLKIKSLVSEFIDHGNRISLINTKDNTIFAGIDCRYICENIHYEISNYHIRFCIKPNFFYSADRNNNLLDFVFVFENKNFMLPYEVVRNGEIEISELSKFEFIDDASIYLNNFYNGLMNKNNVI
jgi:hypothetical protein